MEKAFENNDPEAINAIIELIPAISEERRTFALTDAIKPKMNIKNYAKILSDA
jgi:hypothetical protein